MKKLWIVLIVLLIVAVSASIGLFAMAQTTENPEISDTAENTELSAETLSLAPIDAPKTFLTDEEMMEAFAQAEAEAGGAEIQNAADLTQEQYRSYLKDVTDRAYEILSDRMKDGYSWDRMPLYKNINLYDGSKYIVSSERQGTTGIALLAEVFADGEAGNGDIDLYMFGPGWVWMVGGEPWFMPFYPTETQYAFLDSLPTEAELAAQNNAAE